MNTDTNNKEADISRKSSKACQAPGQDDWVYDYFNQQLNERGEQAFEDHLYECGRCQQILLTLDWAYREMRRINSNEAESSETASAKRRSPMNKEPSKD
jgi:hypothetical protein